MTLSNSRWFFVAGTCALGLTWGVFSLIAQEPEKQPAAENLKTQASDANTPVPANGNAAAPRRKFEVDVIEVDGKTSYVVTGEKKDVEAVQEMINAVNKLRGDANSVQSVKSFPLQHMLCSDAEAVVKALVGDHVRIVADPRTNSLVVSTHMSQDFAVVEKVLKQLDQQAQLPQFGAQEKKLLELTLERNILLEKYAKNHPHVMRVDTQIQAIQKQLRARLLNAEAQQPPSASVLQRRNPLMGISDPHRTWVHNADTSNCLECHAVPQDDHHAMNAGVATAQFTIQRLRQSYLQLERAADHAAKAYREGKNRGQAEQQIVRNAVAKAFEARQRLQTAEIMQARADVERVASRLLRRDVLREKIIDRRVDELLIGIDVNWDARAKRDPGVSLGASGVPVLIGSPISVAGPAHLPGTSGPGPGPGVELPNQLTAQRQAITSLSLDGSAVLQLRRTLQEAAARVKQVQQQLDHLSAADAVPTDEVAKLQQEKEAAEDERQLTLEAYRAKFTRLRADYFNARNEEEVCRDRLSNIEDLHTQGAASKSECQQAKVALDDAQHEAQAILAEWRLFSQVGKGVADKILAELGPLPANQHAKAPTQPGAAVPAQETPVKD